MWAVNMAISGYTAIQTGNIWGLAGGIVGGAVFGALGKTLGGDLAGVLGESTYSFGGGALIGAVEFGMGGFGSGFGAALASGQSIGQAFRSGGMGAAIGAGTGAMIEGSYMAGWQNSMHGLSRQGAFESQMRSLHNLSVNANDQIEADVTSRSAFGVARHEAIDAMGSNGDIHFEMGPDSNNNIAVNGGGSLGSASSGTIGAYNSGSIAMVQESVSQSGLQQAISLYGKAFVDIPTHYNPLLYNSNYAANEVLFGAGGHVVNDGSLGWTPSGVQFNGF